MDLFSSSNIPRLLPVVMQREQEFIGHLVWGDLDSPFSDLRPECFADPKHREIFACVQRIVADGEVVSPAAVLSRMEDELADLNGVAFLAELVKQAHAGPSASICADEIMGAWQRRVAISIYEAMPPVCEEGVTHALGITSRADPRQLLITQAAWLATLFALVKRAITPLPPALMFDADKTAQLVSLVPEELAELAVIHDSHAAVADLKGDAYSARMRRDRAQQIRGLLGEVEP